jgi:hypothetical protein
MTIDVNKDAPLYRSHKTVRALEIKLLIMPAAEGGSPLLMFADPEYPSQSIDPVMVARYVPVPGDFYVIYEDGYRSFSPRKAFLEGYTLVQGDE